LSTKGKPSAKLATRGGNAFDAAALRSALAQLPIGTDLDLQHVEDYRAFYSLNFPHIAHTHRMFCLQGADERLVVQYYLPEHVRGYVMLCHGYYDHVGLFAYTIEYLMHHGLAVVTYDQIGHGLSTGDPVTIETFDRYVEATHVVHAHARAELHTHGAWHWVGQSMGGAIVMEYLQQFPPDEGKYGEIILLAPLIRPYAWWLNRWVFAIAKLTISQRPRVLSDNAENPEFHALQEIDPLQARILPVAWVQAMVDWHKRFVRYPASDFAPKLLQGDADRTVDWKFNLKTYERRYPNARHCIIAGGRHHLANESPEKRQQMWTFLDEHCSW